eukprot:1970018-Alexandrium_andersonii.AAC.1
MRCVKAEGIEKLSALSPAIARAIRRAEVLCFDTRRAAAAPGTGSHEPPQVFGIATPPGGAS